MQLIYVEDKYIKQYDSITSGYNLENTVAEILSGKKVIMEDKTDKQYLRNLIKQKGVIKESKRKRRKSYNKKIIKDRNDTKTTKIYSNKSNNNIKNCNEIYMELLNEGYILDFSKTALHNRLANLNILYKENNSFFIHRQYIDDGYFINGKESKKTNLAMYTIKY